MVLANDDYIISSWHIALLSFAFTGLAIIFNTLLFRKLPLLEGLVMVLYCVGFVTFLTILWVMVSTCPASVSTSDLLTRASDLLQAPRNDVSVLTTFNDNGWTSPGLACLVGIAAPVVTTIGADSSCHLSEELKDASWVLPRSMIATAVTNYVVGFVMLGESGPRPPQRRH